MKKLGGRPRLGLARFAPSAFPNGQYSRLSAAARRQRLLRMPSTIFLASPNSIMVLSRKKSSFSTPA